MPLLTTGAGKYPAAGGGGVVTTTAYTNFVARTSGLNTLHLDAYKALFSDLTTAGIFNSDGTSSKLDIFYVFATQDSTTSLLNLVNTPARNCTVVVGTLATMFLTDIGIHQNGSGDWLDTHYDPAANMVNLNLASSCCLFGYNHESRGATNAVVFGARQGGGNTEFFIAPYWSDNNTFFRICDGSATNPAPGGSKGWYAGNRSANTGTNCTQQYFNPAGTFISQGNDAAQTPNTGNTVAVLAMHEGGTTITFPSGGDFCSAMGAGASMTAAQHTSLWNAVKAYLTTVGAYP